MKSYRSLHPNHVHQLAVTVSKHYWLTNDGIIKYQKKPIEMSLEKLEGSTKRHLIHYVIRDHFSGVVYSNASPSDSIIPLEKFLYDAWKAKDVAGFSGVPVLMTLPETVERSFPGVREHISLLGIQFVKVTSGFQSGIRDVQTIEEHMKFYVGRPMGEVVGELNRLGNFVSNMKGRVGKKSKLALWAENIKTLRVPSESWVSDGRKLPI